MTDHYHANAFDDNVLNNVEDSNLSTNAHFNEVLTKARSRRDVLQGGVGIFAAMALGSTALVGCGSDSNSTAPAEEAVTTPPTTTTPPTDTTTGVVQTDRSMDLPTELKFKPVNKNKNDIVTVPEGYTATVLIPMGTPLVSSLPDWDDSGLAPSESFSQRVGDNHDGMHLYGLADNGTHDPKRSDRMILVVNHEYVVATYLNPLGYINFDNPDATAPTIYKKIRLVSDIRREVNATGVTVVELQRDKNNQFKAVKDSKFNKRITGDTVCDLSGPAAGADIMVTKFSTNGKQTRGINNLCGNGTTPWGTYLTCEENFRDVFSRGADTTLRAAKDNASLLRYGRKPNAVGGSYLWHTGNAKDAIIVDEFARWDVTATEGKTAVDDYRNAMNTFGWIVEIDPFSPQAKPVKRTALGRFAHEDCHHAPVVEGKPVVWYMGDDARNEYIYKFVSKALWSTKDFNGGIAAGNKYMDEGTLYVAKFNADGKGEWIELTYGKNGLNTSNSVYPFTSQAEVVTFARMAADSVGATMMDRPEWYSVSPVTGEVYGTLTNNVERGQTTTNRYNKDAVETKVKSVPDAANPRSYEEIYVNDDGSKKTNKGNVNGHIIRWRELANNHAATAFDWDVYLFAAQDDANKANINISNLTSVNDLSSPDGLWFDPRGVLWIQTDDGAYTDVTNCMLLAALPGKVGDGAKQTIISTTKDGEVSNITPVGAKPAQQQLSRFLVGPIECEITGIAMTPDGKTLLVNVQHPGEDAPNRANPTSHWPDSQTNTNSKRIPRSATVMITKNDGGVILS